MHTIRGLDDEDDARAIHALAFPEDDWVGDGHTFWVARDDRARVVGFCSAIYYPDREQVFLSRAAVVRAAQGCGLHKRMIQMRVLWSWFQGAKDIITYTTLQNYPSMANLLDCGFRFYKPPTAWATKRVHYFRKILE